ESAMEFLRIARGETYHNIVLSMKASNPKVMVQAYRLLIQQMDAEFGECYPLHLGVTEAGDGEDGRVKSAAGIGTLLEDGIGDTIRVSLTEDPEFEIPVCKDLVKRYEGSQRVRELESQKTLKSDSLTNRLPDILPPRGLPYNPFEYKRRKTFAISNIGENHVPVVIADLSKLENITPASLESIGYKYDATTDKWNISDAAADYIFTGKPELNFALPGTLKVITWPNYSELASDKEKYLPIYDAKGFVESDTKNASLNFVMLDCFSDDTTINDFTFLDELANDTSVVLCLSSTNKNAMQSIRSMFVELMKRKIENPVIITTDSNWQTPDEHLIHYSTEAGALLLDGFGDGICFGITSESYKAQDSTNQDTTGRNYSSNSSVEQFINSTAFSILQATRTRISKTEYISCPSCGRTLFDLQETTAKIRNVTNHLKGVKIAIMGCIVNGPGEMADADFGYVGSGVGKITLYRGKEVVKKNIDSDIAVAELINLLKESDAWVEPSLS
ncbi:MAG: flavodoxin-dependent (E)-4-hydroxy-3-methylbut-2-enyl-diphosphate synthase, partial [Pedobacter sp.]|nr:flavodoxin-dependent (E)-4-hydroxy-3-methylbut-2-enyl-diphosphate synthase [Chitinophagaceae bacterium]